MSRSGTVRRAVAGFLSAAMVAIVGVGVLAPETAQGAGVMVERHPAYGATLAQPTRERDPES